MRNTRPLWYSVIAVALLVIASLAGFLTRDLKPTLGLDLEGGLSVILAAPDGTPRDVLNQALENIRTRVDAFGVGEPEIFVSGTNIEIQLPGLAPGTIRARTADEYCVENPDGTSYGCANDQATAQKAIGDISVTTQPLTVCVVDADGKTLDQKNLCFTNTDTDVATQEAQNALQTITVAPKASPSASGSASPTPSASPAGPSAGGPSCLTDGSGTTYRCFPTQDDANTAKSGLTTKTTVSTFCLTAAATEPVATPSPTPSPSTKPKTGKGKTPSPSPTPTPIPSAYSGLTNKAALPCFGSGFDTKDQAQAALDALKPAHVTQTFCVISSAGKNLGCFLTRDEAVAQQKETGQQHLLDVIGQTARLEERVVQKILPATDPTPLTCGTAAEQQTPACSFDALANKQVVYAGQGGAKYVLGPIVISGSDIKKATAVFQQATQTNVSQVGWAVNFQLNGPGSAAFAKATQIAVNAPAPTNQIAIAVDRTIISSPVVQGAITGGNGVISGGFSEQRAKDLATQLNAGALPVELTRQSVQTVSPTLGQESLHQGIVAGVAGLIALFLYLLFYYRLLGIVAWLGMSIWATLAFAIVSIAGKEFGYSLTLAGIAGLAISLGVTADSYIVFFERLKDEVRSGKTPRSAVQPAFKRAYRTIVAADLVTGIAAVVLYLTAVSSVKGFALTLGVATVLDLFVVYFFKRPTVFLLARNERLVNLHGFGLTSGMAAEPDPIAGGSE